MVAVKEKVERLGLNDSVQFCGTSDEMHKMYQAMDVFLMPSLFEGLPVTVIEAQASNLPCVLSDTITKDCAISGAIKFVKLDADINEWVDAIQAFSDKERDSNEVIQKLREAGFDQNKMIGDFYDFYIDICKKILSQNKSKH